ncbi:MAG: thiamine-phosphate diphosphorylase [Rhizobiales bacterium 65-79]|jgi:thiamine-phosphate pyrophosphorylase|nr:thiamine phosphate synthase [Hyphomicrobiales bacterium]OJU00257.1 MAG: thiamine-phosphate diphosphorylase [Rhizobiales bacterium 65-79]
MKKPFDLSLYLVLDPELCEPLGMVETTRAAVAGGVTMVQLRDKRATTAEMIETGRALQAILAETGVPLVVNDDVEAAIALDADGLHVGQEDCDARSARERIGPDMILGVSVETEPLAAAIDPAIVDYAGVGPVFATATKPDHKQPVGLDGLARLVAASPVPTVAISGLKAEHAASVLAAGAEGLAVVSAICGKPDPRSAAIAIAEAIAAARQEMRRAAEAGR